jgi:hypothetical protein
LTTHDVGDGWEYTIAIEKAEGPVAGQVIPGCVAGAQKRVPED